MDAIKERSRQEAEKKDKLNPCVRGASKGRSAMRNSTRRNSMRNPRASRRPTRTGTLALPSTRLAPRHILPTERSSPPWQMCTYERVRRSNFLVLLEVQLLWLLAPDSPKKLSNVLRLFLETKNSSTFPQKLEKGSAGRGGGRKEGGATASPSPVTTYFTSAPPPLHPQPQASFTRTAFFLPPVVQLLLYPRHFFPSIPPSPDLLRSLHGLFPAIHGPPSIPPSKCGKGPGVGRSKRGKRHPIANHRPGFAWPKSDCGNRAARTSRCNEIPWRKRSRMLKAVQES